MLRNGTYLAVLSLGVVVGFASNANAEEKRLRAPKPLAAQEEVGEKSQPGELDQPYLFAIGDRIGMGTERVLRIWLGRRNWPNTITVNFDRSRKLVLVNFFGGRTRADEVKPILEDIWQVIERQLNPLADAAGARQLSSCDFRLSYWNEQADKIVLVRKECGEYVMQ